MPTAQSDKQATHATQGWRGTFALVLPAIYATACIVVAVAMSIFMRGGVDDSPQYLTPFAFAVVIATLLGGMAGGIIATVNAVFVIDLMFHRPSSLFTMHDLALLIVFAAMSAATSWLIATRRRAEIRHRATAHELRTITDGVPLLIAQVDRDQTYRFVNRHYEVWFGLPREAIIGRRVDEILGKSVADILQPYVERVLAGHPQQFELWLDYKHGGRRHVLVSKLPCRDDEGRITGYFTITLDTTGLARAEDELRESRQRQRLIAESLPVFVWSCGPDGQVDYLNDRWYAYTGLAEGDSASKPIHPDDRAAADGIWAAAKAARTPFAAELRIRSGTGEYRWHLARAEPTFDEHGAVVRWYGSTIDIHDRKLAQERLQAAMEAARTAQRAAEEASLAKDRFIATLSHELRTPLTPVVTSVHMLAVRRDLPADVRETLSMIRRNVEREARLIDDLLDVTRISRGRITLAIATIDPYEPLREVLQMCAGEISEARLDLALALDPTPLTIDVDPARLRQVLWNVIKNAVKFTPPGGTITVRSRFEARGRALAISISDTGVGIAPEVLPHLFEPFEQGPVNRPGDRSGLGLGLAICRTLMHLHGGSITAESAGPGAGSTFTLYLTARPALAPRLTSPGQTTPNAVGPDAYTLAGDAISLGAGQAGHPGHSAAVGDPGQADAHAFRAPVSYVTAAAATSPTRGLRLLLVEDHGDTRRAMERLLIGAGHQVIAAESVEDAIDAFERAGGQIDLLVSDMGLPDGSGIDVIHRLRQQRPNLPGITVSGYGMDEDIRRSRAAGFAEHLTKPIDVERLLLVLGQVAAQASQELHEPKAPESKAPSSSAPETNGAER